jgi:hypothetical protein
MSALKYRHIGLFPNMELISAKSIPGDEKQKKRPKIQLDFAGEVRVGQGTEIKVKSREFAEDAEIFWKCKVNPEIFKILQSIGLKQGSICSIKAAIDNWGSQEAGGAWFEFIELVSCDGKELNYKSPLLKEKSSKSEEDFGNLEKEINTELSAYGY